MTPNLDGVEVEGRCLVTAHVDGTPDESVLFHSLKARERLQRPLTEYLTPGNERKAGTAHAESGRVPTTVPLTSRLRHCPKRLWWIRRGLAMHSPGRSLFSVAWVSPSQKLQVVQGRSRR